MEAYQTNAVDSIVQRMSVLAKYPKQVVVLKGTRYICSLKGKKAGLSRRMINRETTEQFGEFCRFIKLGQLGDPWYRNQILERQDEASRHLDAVRIGGLDLTDHYAVFEAQFTDAEKRDIRLRHRLKTKTLQKFVQLVAAFAGRTFEDHPHTGRWPKPNEWPYTFIYRSAILHYLHFFEWIRIGSPKSLSPKKVRNDLIDLNFATYATFFDGLMTDDARTSALYKEACEYIDFLFIPAMTRAWENEA